MIKKEISKDKIFKKIKNLRVKKIINKIIVLLVILLAILGIGYAFTLDRSPIDLYRKAMNNTNSKNYNHIINTVSVEGDSSILGMENSKIEYEFDRSNQIIMAKTYDGDTVNEIYINKNKVYLKDDILNSYIDLGNSDMVEYITNTLLIQDEDIHSSYNAFYNKIMEQIDSTGITKTKKVISSNDKNEKVTELSMKVSTENTGKIMQDFISSSFNEDSERLIEENIRTQELIANQIGKTISEEEKKLIKETVKKELMNQIDTTLKSMKYKDVEVIVGINKDKCIKYVKQIYVVTLGDKEVRVENTVDYIESSLKNISIPEDKEFLTIEEALERKATIEKEKILNTVNSTVEENKEDK